MKIKKGDKIKVLSGKDKSKTGKVLQVFPKNNKISIEGINLMVKHLRPKREREHGQKIQFPAPFNISNVMLICPKCGRPVRVGYKVLENKKKVRVCRKCKETF